LITGLLISFGPKTIKHDVEELHEMSIYYLVAFLVLHLGGVLLAELTNQKGIVSRIISGAKNKDQ
jgi:cytochrome b